MLCDDCGMLADLPLNSTAELRPSRALDAPLGTRQTRRA